MHTPYAEYAALCSHYQGTHIDDIEFRKHADALDWQGVWPVIDADLCLVGTITDGEDCYFNWCDEAMILRSDATNGGWRINFPNDGYAMPPKDPLHKLLDEAKHRELSHK